MPTTAASRAASSPGFTFKLDKVFTDKARGKDTKRRQLTASLEYLREGDLLFVHSMDPLGRNAGDLLSIVRELTGREVSVEFVKNRLTFAGKADPMGKLMLTMLAAFGELERELMRERQRKGIAVAKAKGVYKGRKKALGPVEAYELVVQAHAGNPRRIWRASMESVEIRCTSTFGKPNKGAATGLV